MGSYAGLFEAHQRVGRQEVLAAANHEAARRQVLACRRRLRHLCSRTKLNAEATYVTRLRSQPVPGDSADSIEPDDLQSEWPQSCQLCYQQPEQPLDAVAKAARAWSWCTHHAEVTILASQAWLRHTHACPACGVAATCLHIHWIRPASGSDDLLVRTMPSRIAQ